MSMNEQDKIYVKIQIEKDQNSGNLMIRTHFDPKAPNFYHNKNDISWCPTPKEIEFINEAFELVPSYKKQQSSFKNETKKEKTRPPLEQETTEEIVMHNQDDAPENTDNDAQKSESDAPIEKKELSDGFIVEANEDTIIDRVLKQKKKGKW